MSIVVFRLQILIVQFLDLPCRALAWNFLLPCPGVEKMPGSGNRLTLRVKRAVDPVFQTFGYPTAYRCPVIRETLRRVPTVLVPEVSGELNPKRRCKK